MRIHVAIFLAFAAVLAAAPLQGAATADKLGIILMHGMQGFPNDRPISEIGKLLDASGYIVIEPEMCWSKSRDFDKPYADCLGELDASVAKLRAKGASAIVISGQSLGGSGSLWYGANRDEIKGIVAMAPAGDSVATPQNQPAAAKSVAKAHALLAAGKGDEKAYFDFVNGRPTVVHTSPKILLTFWGDTGLDKIPDNTAKLRAPVLWVAGRDDPSQRGGPDWAFAKAPANPLNRYVVVDSDHLGTPSAGKTAIMAWLKELMAH